MPPNLRAEAGAEAEGLRVVYADADLLVLDKPAGMVVHPAPGHRGRTLAEIVAGIASGGEEHRPGIVHRLDRDTSGLLVVARTPSAHAALSAAISAREVSREYVALVEGHLATRTGTIDAPIGRDPRRRERMTVGGRARREARTHFEVAEVLPADTLCDVRLETGRTHQIRAHFAAIGHPVAGDPTYGRRARHGLTRQFLHAARLSFRHPATSEQLSFSSPLPGDLAEALVRARAGLG